MNSSALFRRALRCIPGGVNSPVRAFRSVGGTPPFIERARGSRIRDVDGREYIDFVMSWGALPLGHAHPEILAAIRNASENGTTFGAPTAAEVELAQTIASAISSIELLRLTTSGTEATMALARVARAATRREIIVKFDGCYHGHADAYLVKAGSGLLTFGVPSSAGVPPAVAKRTAVLPYNDIDAARNLLRRWRRRVAAVIVEPVAGNMGVVLPREGFLETLREETSRHGALLIFDEVITGFRARWGGAQDEFGVLPDLTAMGKVIGGGLPLAAFGGRRDLMRWVTPQGPVYHAGTLSGNPLAVRAGLATLRLLASSKVYRTMCEHAASLAEGLSAVARRHGVPVTVNRWGTMLTLFFHPGPVGDARAASQSDTGRFRRFFHRMLRRGIYLPPSQFEAWFVSAAHSGNDIERCLRVADDSFRKL